MKGWRGEDATGRSEGPPSCRPESQVPCRGWSLYQGHVPKGRSTGIRSAPGGRRAAPLGCPDPGAPLRGPQAIGISKTCR